MKNLSHKLAAAMTVGALSMNSTDAFAAAGGFDTIAGNIEESVGEVPRLLSVLSYLAGIGLGISGVLKLKDHVENPQNAPLKTGAVRLGVGGALLAMPTVLNAMTGSIGTAGTASIPDIPTF